MTVIWLISSFRLILHQSIARLVVGNGSQTMPNVVPFDFSGFRLGFPVVMMARAMLQSATEAPGGKGPPAPLGQRTGSRVFVKAAKPPALDSGMFGARKPSEQVARNA